MIDICLSVDMDLVLSDDGDILIVESIAQAIRTRLLWIKGEWRFGPDIGFPWFSEVFVKQPNLSVIQQSIRNAIMDVAGVSDCNVEVISYDRAKRTIVFGYNAYTEEGVISEEVELYG